MEKKTLETRYYSADYETRAEGDEGIIIGRPIVYSSWTDLGWFDEIIEPNALDGADMSDVRLCLNHDTSYVYARSRRGNLNNTMSLNPNAEGLDIEARLNLAGSPKAQDYFSAVSRGDMSGMSFMFSVASDQWDDIDSDHPKRHILKIASVVEVSAVTFPAYDATAISARSKEALENARRALENARSLNAEKPVETGIDELALEKAKTKIILQRSIFTR